MTAAQRLDAIETRLAELEARVEVAAFGMEHAFAAGRASITDPHRAPGLPQPARAGRHLSVVTR